MDVPMTMAPKDFTHLHVHSEFSLLDGLGRVGEIVDAAAAHGMDSIALTDHGALYGAVAFYQACKKAEIKPIIGVETYIARRSMADREGKADAQPYHLILLAKDWTGYQNLCRIVTDAHLDGYYYKPRIDREYLAQHSEGLVGLSACLNGEVARSIETMVFPFRLRSLNCSPSTVMRGAERWPRIGCEACWATATVATSREVARIAPS